MGVARLWREAPLWRHALTVACACTLLVLFFPPSCSSNQGANLSTPTGSSLSAQPATGSGSYVSATPPTPAIPGNAATMQSPTTTATSPSVISGPPGAVHQVLPPPKIKPGNSSDSITVEKPQDDFGSIKNSKRP